MHREPPRTGSCPTEPHGCPLLGPGSRGAAAGASATLMDGAPWGLLGAAGGGAGGFVCCQRRCRELASARAAAAPHRPAAALHHPRRTVLEPSTAGTEVLGTRHGSEPHGAPVTPQPPQSAAGTCQAEAGRVVRIQLFPQSHSPPPSHAAAGSSPGTLRSPRYRARGGTGAPGRGARRGAPGGSGRLESTASDPGNRVGFCAASALSAPGPG